MPYYCKKCGAIVTGRYCSCCGQKTTTEFSDYALERKRMRSRIRRLDTSVPYRFGNSVAANMGELSLAIAGAKFKLYPSNDAFARSPERYFEILYKAEDYAEVVYDELLQSICRIMDGVENKQEQDVG